MAAIDSPYDADPPSRRRKSWVCSLVCLAILALLTCARLAAATRSGLAPDEAYYWLWSRHLAAGYFDHPPMIAWWIRGSTLLLGDNALAVRLPSILASLVASAAVFAAAFDLFDGAIGPRASLWFNLTILIAIGSIFATPDAPSVLFWALAIWALARLRRTGRGRLWLLVGVFAGLGCLSKYTNLFLGPGILLWLASDRRARLWLATPWPWAGGLVALAVFWPNLEWNAAHQWVTFSKQFGRIPEGRLGLRYVGEFLAGQFGLLNPAITVLAGAAVIDACGARRLQSAAATGFLTLLSAPLALYMLAHSFHDRVQGNWPAPIYAAIALVAAGSARNLNWPAEWRRAMVAAVIPLGLITALAGFAVLAMPEARLIPIRAPNERLMAGWPDFAHDVESLRAQSGAGWIGTTSYGLTGELTFELRGRASVAAVVERARYEFARAPDDLDARPVLLVVEKDKDDWRRVQSCFEQIEILPDLTRRSGGRVVEIYGAALARQPRRKLMSAGCW